jgi:hypothetical protein
MQCLSDGWELDFEENRRRRRQGISDMSIAILWTSFNVELRKSPKAYEKVVCVMTLLWCYVVSEVETIIGFNEKILMNLKVYF